MLVKQKEKTMNKLKENNKVVFSDGAFCVIENYSVDISGLNGTIVYIWDNKIHNWEGPARIPEGNNRLREYYIYGIQKTEEEWKEAKRSGKGLPWYKDPRFKSRTAG